MPLRRLTAVIGLAWVLLLPFSVAHAADRSLGSLHFQACTLANEGGTRSVEAQCTTLQVLEDRSKPQGRKLSLRLAWLPASSEDAAPDPVVFIAGGPGQAASEAFWGVMPALEPLREKRNILLLDQRGTGGSNRLSCPDTTDSKGLGDQTAESDEQIQAGTRSCLEALSSRADVSQYTTEDAVADLEALRLAVGAPSLDLIGGSYGTRVALEYLRRHPQTARTTLVDGIVPPQLVLGQDHARNLQDALDRIFAGCVADKVCHERFGDPAVTMRTLREHLAKGPINVRLRDPVDYHWRDERLSEGALVTVLRLYSYSPEFATLLPMLLDETVKGSPESMVAQGLMLVNQLKDQFAPGMELSVICSEDADLMKIRPEDADTLLGNELPRYAINACKVWPHKARPADFHDPVVSDRPVLLLSGAWDPVTPPQYGEQVLATLSDAVHFVAPGQGHIIMARGCAPKLVEQFIESADPKSLDGSCLDELRAPPFFTHYYGYEP